MKTRVSKRALVIRAIYAACLTFATPIQIEFCRRRDNDLHLGIRNLSGEPLTHILSHIFYVLTQSRIDLRDSPRNRGIQSRQPALALQPSMHRRYDLRHRAAKTHEVESMSGSNLSKRRSLPTEAEEP
jgi:hypothetical protein